MIIPVGVEYNSRRYPVVTFTLMGINVLLYLVSLVFFFNNLDGDVAQREWLTMNLGLIPDQKVWWTYLTSLFVHADFFHLIGNMIYLFLFGSCLEDLIGRWQFSIFYFFTGLVATVTYLIFVPGGKESSFPLVGASGAISGCIGGFALVFAKTKINFRYFFWFMFRFYTGEFALAAWLVISFWFLIDLVLAALNNASGEVAFTAHVGGTIVGAGLIAIWKFLPHRYKFTLELDDDSDALQPVYVNLRPAPVTAENATIYLYENGSQLGPFTSRQILQMIQLGSIGATVSYWQEGMPEWRSVSEYSPM